MCPTSSGWNWNGNFSLIISQCLSRMPGFLSAIISGSKGLKASSSFLIAVAMERQPGLSLIALLLRHFAMVLLYVATLFAMVSPLRSRKESFSQD